MTRPNIIYTAIIEDEHYGWMPLEVWTRGEPPTTAEGRLLMAATVAAECAEGSDHDDPGLEKWPRWMVHEIHIDDPSKTRDVTTQAIRALVDAANGKGQFPAWWAEHVQLAPEQLDTYDPDDAEDWSPVTLQKRIGDALMTVDLTKLTAPLGLLDEAYGEGTKSALMAHGGPYETYSFFVEGWVETQPEWFPGSTYRVKPQPLTKPDIPWHLMADWVQYVSRDEDGAVWAHGKRPEKVETCWLPRGGKSHYLGMFKIDSGTCDWRDSLVERPEAD